MSALLPAPRTYGRIAGRITSGLVRRDVALRAAGDHGDWAGFHAVPDAWSGVVQALGVSPGDSDHSADGQPHEYKVTISYGTVQQDAGVKVPTRRVEAPGLVVFLRDHIATTLPREEEQERPIPDITATMKSFSAILGRIPKYRTTKEDMDALLSDVRDTSELRMRANEELLD